MSGGKKILNCFEECKKVDKSVDSHAQQKLYFMSSLLCLSEQNQHKWLSCKLLQRQFGEYEWCFFVYSHIGIHLPNTTSSVLHCTVYHTFHTICIYTIKDVTLKYDIWHIFIYLITFWVRKCRILPQQIVIATLNVCEQIVLWKRNGCLQQHFTSASHLCLKTGLTSLHYTFSKTYPLFIFPYFNTISTSMPPT